MYTTRRGSALVNDVNPFLYFYRYMCNETATFCTLFDVSNGRRLLLIKMLTFFFNLTTVR